MNGEGPWAGLCAALWAVLCADPNPAAPRMKNRTSVLVLLAGVIYYFSEGEVKNLFREFEAQFGSCDVLFDYSSPRGTKIANKKVIEKGGMSANANLKWGIGNIRGIEKWGGRINVISSMPMFKEHKKRYPLMRRIGMNISDALMIMSLAHVKIGKEG